MTDKRLKSFLEDRLKRLESIRNEREFTTAELGDIACCKQTLAFIDSLQEEPVNKDFEMALAEMIDKAQKCVVEPLVVAEQWKDYLIELAKSEKPVSESIDFEQELYKAFGQIKDFTLGIAIAKRFYDMGRKHKEPVSEELEKAANEYIGQQPLEDYEPALYKAFIAGAKWQKEQMEKEYSDLNKGLVSANGVAVYMAYETGKKDIIGKVRSILNKVACENYGLDVNGDYCEQPYIELDDEFKKLLKED